MKLEEITEIYETENVKTVNKKLNEGFRIIKIHCGEKFGEVREEDHHSNFNPIKGQGLKPYTRYILGKID